VGSGRKRRREEERSVVSLFFFLPVVVLPFVLRAVVMTSPSFNLYRIVVLPAASSPTMTILVGCCDQLLMIFWIKLPIVFVFVSESVLELF
jgi:hypothetical protein